MEQSEAPPSFAVRGRARPRPLVRAIVGLLIVCLSVAAVTPGTADPGTFGAEVVVAPTTGGKNQSNPSVALDPSGNLYVAWDGEIAGAREVFVSRSTDRGRTFAAPIRVAAGGQGNQTNPALAVDSAGTLFVAWEDRSGGDADISVARSTGSWSAFGASAVASDGTADEINPAITLDGTNVYVAWEDLRTDRDIRAAASPAASLAFGSSVRVDDDAGGAWQHAPSLAADGAGVYAVWYDRRNVDPLVFLSRSADGGATWSASARVSEATASGPEFEPDIALQGGRAYIVWQDGRSGLGRDVYFASAATSDLAFGTSVKVNGGTAGSNRGLPAVAVGPDGRIHVAWEDFRNGVHDIFYASSVDAGATFAEERANREGGDVILDKASPDLAVGASGALYLAWKDERPGDARIVVAAPGAGGTTDAVSSLLPWIALVAVVVVAGFVFLLWRRRRAAAGREAAARDRGRNRRPKR